MVPYYPEFVVVVHFVAYHLTAVGVGHNCAVERLAVKSKSAARIHIIADVLEHGAGSLNVLLVVIGKLCPLACGEPLGLVEENVLLGRNLKSDIFLKSAVNKRSIVVWVAREMGIILSD